MRTSLMKKILYITLTLCALLCVSCEKDPIGGTATEALSGQWYVQVDAINADNTVWAEDPFGMGRILMLTHNNNANDAGTLYVNLDGRDYFWYFKVQVPCDIGAMTFGLSPGKSVTNEAIMQDEKKNDVLYDIQVELWDGVIVKNGMKSPSGMPVDSISFRVKFEDDVLPANYGFDHYRIHGWRFTGFVADN